MAHQFVIGEKINPATISQKVVLRYLDIKGFLWALRNNQKVWSWGAHAWTHHKTDWLRCKVNGHHHKGHIYFMVNAKDLFLVVLTTTHGRIVDILDDVFVGDLVDLVDEKVEYIPQYKNR